MQIYRRSVPPLKIHLSFGGNRPEQHQRTPRHTVAVVAHRPKVTSLKSESVISFVRNRDQIMFGIVIGIISES